MFLFKNIKIFSKKLFVIIYGAPVSICFANPHKRIRATSRYKLLKAFEKPLKSGSKVCCKLAKALLAYARLAYYKPSTSLWQVFYKLATSLLQAVLNKKISFVLYSDILKLSSISISYLKNQGNILKKFISSCRYNEVR